MCSRRSWAARSPILPSQFEQAEQAMKARGMPDWLITHQRTAAQIAANGGARERE